MNPIKPLAINQYTPDITPGDGVSNSLFFIKKILTALGYESNLYADNIHPELTDIVLPRTSYCDRGSNILFLHHAVAHPDPEWFANLKDRVIMVYHNITPSHYFDEGSPHLMATRLGRQQLHGWQDLFAGIIADSRYNAQELKGLGYHNIHEIPLLVDFENLNKIIVDEQIAQKHEKTFNLLFVGRIAENKCQHDLIHALAQLNDKNVHLFCVGGVTSPDYHNFLMELTASYGLQDQVHLTGRVSDEALWGYYKAADLFVCLSDHEGFGIPLIEAAMADVPVVAYDSSNIRHTLGGTGLLLSHKNACDVAAQWQKLITQPEWRYRLAKSQQTNLPRFSFEVLKNQLNDFLDSLVTGKSSGKSPGEKNPLPCHIKDVPSDKKPVLTISLEGPFDSNYSLALVNRELAIAMTRQNMQVELHSTEGGGDYLPNQNFLKGYPEIRELWNKGVRQQKAGLAIRNLFPPRVTGMNGKRAILGPYGWEESVFPLEWVNLFNRRLNMVTGMSDYVTRTLKNNGVTSPMVTTGIGADHLKDVEPCKLPFDFPQGYTLLHISSCFPRKGADLLIDAFAAAYDSEIKATLIIITFPNPRNTIQTQLAQAGWTGAEINGVRTLFHRCKNTGKTNKKKKIILVEGDLTPGQIVSLYQQSDLLVAPSKGEGYGLPMAEAMVFDLPVLTTGYGGQADFCTHKTAWLIDYSFTRAKTHLNLPDSVWVEPVLDDLIKKMKEIYRLSPEKIQQKTNLAKENILKNHTWEQVVKRLKNAVRSLDGQTCPRQPPCIGWITTWNTKCGIASYSNYLIDTIGIDTITILANKTDSLTKPDTHHVIRCWQANDKGTDNANNNLSELSQKIISHNITDLVIQFNFSFFNLQAFSEFLTAMGEKNIRCYIFFHSTADVIPPHEPKSLSTIKEVLCKATRLFVHSIHDLNFYKKLGIIDNVILFPHGVEDSYQYVPGSLDTRLIAAYGFLLPHKGIRELIAAFEILKTDKPELKLLLLNALYPDKSSSQEQHLCRKQIEDSCYSDDITMINDYLTQEEINQKLSRARLIVYPHQHTQESSSASVRTGLATGRPVAVTPLEIFEDVRDAVHALPGTSPDQIARGIKKILDTETSDSRQKAWLESHRWETVARRLELIISSMGTSL